MLILAYDENDNIVHIKDAEKGKSYRCPDCGAEVRPRKGTKKTHHFFHMNAEDCGNSGESIVHKYYKEIIASQKTVQYNGIEMMVTNSKIEQTLPNLLTGSHIIADVMLELNGYKWIAVEVCYKNHKDENHVDIYNTLDMECFEVYVDMNEKQTDFEITGYKKIASIEQYGIKIEEETKIEVEQRLKKDHDNYVRFLRENEKKLKQQISNIKKTHEKHVLNSTGYHMSQIIDTFWIDGKKITFIDLMNKINYMIKKYKPTAICLRIKEIKYCKDDYDSFTFDIEFEKTDKIITTIKDVYTHSIEYNEYFQVQDEKYSPECDNSVKRLAKALSNKYEYVTNIENDRIVRKRKYKDNPFSSSIKRKDSIFIYIDGDVRGYKKRFDHFYC